ncbi:MAG TPA: helix-turn-helix transcriptional regulator [Mycobacteriales bacterium]|nr:helix-turn-helix transcriptional regulator [Mycobacteriales bacterium]
MNEAARLLRHARRRAGLTQRALAEKAGVAQSVVGRIESSRVDPTVTTLSKLLRACETTLEALPGSGDGIDHTLLGLQLRQSPHERLVGAAQAANSLNQLFGGLR